MDNLSELFKAIKNTNSSNDKVNLLLAYPQPEELKNFLNFAYNPNIIYGITGNKIQMQSRGLMETVPFEMFDDIRKTSGRNAKIEIIQKSLMPCRQDFVDLCLKAIDRDLGVNINVKVINKAFKDLIPEFGVQLAKPQTKDLFNRVFSHLPYVFLNLKIDGIRCIVHCNSRDEILFFTRDGKEAQEFLTKNIRENILANFDKFKGKKLDGEIYSTKFDKLQKVMNRKYSTSESVLIRDTCKYAIFDIVDPERTLEDRIKDFDSLPTTNFIHYVKYVKMEADYAKIMKIAKEYIAKGHEGIILKNPFALYQMKRTSDMLKFKNKETIDVTILRVVEGEKGTKYEGMLGAIVVDYNGTEVSVGSGFSDKERKELWEIKDTLPDRTAEISFMERTHKSSLRHPVFEMIRTDK